MKEIYLGTHRDQQYINNYLDNIRRLDPIEIVTLPQPLTLSDPLVDQVIDIGRFWEIVSQCLAKCQEQWSINVEQIKADRYYIAQPPDADSPGGFHDPHSLGYQYWYEAAFLPTLNRRLVSKELATIELARGFLHDCFHHSTFRSFRRVVRLPAVSAIAAKHRIPEVYREQYGINFRNEDGLSYSSSDLTAQSPESINLNILMDGVVVMVIAELMKEVVGNVTQRTNVIEDQIRREILLEPFDASVLPRARDFYVAVTAPSQVFVEHWGGKDFISLVLQAMMGGELRPLKRFFEMRMGFPDAWDTKFKRPGFRMMVDPQA